MFGLDRHVSTQCVDYKTYLCACSHTKSRVSAHFLSYEVISMRNVKHMTPCWSPNFLLTSRNDVQPHDLTYEPFSVCNFSHTKDMSENSGLTHAKDCGACSLWKDVLIHNLLTYMDVFACTFSHRSTCLQTTCHTISYVVLDRHVSTQCVYYETCSCACSHTKRRLSVHFLIYEVMPMRNFKHITPCLSNNFSQVQSKQSTSQLFNLQTLLTMQLLTYKDVSLRKLSHRRKCLCATYHIVSYVWDWPTCFREVCRLRGVCMRVFAH